MVREESEVSSWSSKIAELDIVADILLIHSNGRRPSVGEAARCLPNETYLICGMLRFVLERRLSKLVDREGSLKSIPREREGMCERGR